MQSKVEPTMLCHIHKHYTGVAPEYIKPRFISQTSKHAYSTILRAKGGFCIRKVEIHGMADRSMKKNV